MMRVSSVCSCSGVGAGTAWKIISTGQGGVVLTDDPELAVRLRGLKDFGRVTGGHDIYDSLGVNFKFTDFQAVVGVEQFKQLPWRIQRKRAISHQYREALRELAQVEMIQTDLKSTTPWFMDIFVPDSAGLQEHLKRDEVGSRQIYPPIHSQRPYCTSHQEFPVTERWASRGLWLPSSVTLTDTDIDRVCASVSRYFDP